VNEPLIPPRQLFRFTSPLRYRKQGWSDDGLRLDEAFRLVPLESLDGNRPFADVRAAWNEAGLYFDVRVAGKRKPVVHRPEWSKRQDSFHVWTDTRDTHNVHRATRFCQHFVVLPVAGPRRTPRATAVPIERAKELARPVHDDLLPVVVRLRVDGYHLDCHIPADAMVGFSPAEHPRLGFDYSVDDDELGLQTWAVGHPFASSDNPSLWGTLELVK
jgi:hypothetical protein